MKPSCLVSTITPKDTEGRTSKEVDNMLGIRSAYGSLYIWWKGERNFNTVWDMEEEMLNAHD